MFSEPLEINTQHPYLGIILSHNLKWNSHIEYITAKANSTLGFLRRNLRGASRAIRAQAYTSIVRPQLEYASTVWGPHKRLHAQTNKLEDQVEAVQKRAARFVTGDYRPTTSMTDTLRTLGWPSLHQRRQQARLVLMYKAVNNMVAIPIHNILTKNTNITRGHHSRFITIPCKTEAYRASYFPRTVIEWNTLPGTLISCTSLDAFKAGLASHLGLSANTQL
ncbi:hypothetical protein Bbelb_138230 [Branchiostoma belcheri]|nr:hypothetical protein Bbelb_138230 [Branchiostoma belcheri]